MSRINQNQIDFYKSFQNEDQINFLGDIESLLENEDAIFIDNLDESFYHASAGISKSQLMYLKQKTPFHWQQSVMNHFEKSSDALDFGKLVHTAILEPSKINERFFCDEKLCESICGAKPRGTNQYKEAIKEIKERGMTVIPSKMYERLIKIVSRMWESEIVRELFSKGVSEQSIYARCPETGLLLRGRLDRITPDGIMVDIKTTMNADMVEWSWTTYKMGYHIQAMYYAMLARLKYGKVIVPENFIFVILENNEKEPVDYAIRNLDSASLEKAQEIIFNQLNVLKSCFEKNNFYGYEKKIVTSSIPLKGFNEVDFY